MDFTVPKIKTVRIGHDGFHVILEQDSRILMIPWQAALEVAKGMTAQARKVEEIVKANQIISDEAFLNRLGFPMSLTKNPDIKKEAFKEAQYDPKLRKYLPNAPGIPSSEAVGIPGLIQHPPKGGNNGQ
jgi:hypothetical protein